jgi:hypothetical protein
MIVAVAINSMQCIIYILEIASIIEKCAAANLGKPSFKKVNMFLQ